MKINFVVLKDNEVILKIILEGFFKCVWKYKNYKEKYGIIWFYKNLLWKFMYIKY